MAQESDQLQAEKNGRNLSLAYNQNKFIGTEIISQYIEIPMHDVK